MIARAKPVQKKWWGWVGPEIPDPSKLELAAKKLADNLTWCSCHMCCNVRRSVWTKDGQTRQERRQTLAWELKLVDAHQDETKGVSP